MRDFDRVYAEERPFVLAACLALAGDLDAARDATDEAFARALEHWSEVGVMASPGGWTQTVALNFLRRGFRRRRIERIGLRDRSRLATDVTLLPDGEVWMVVRGLPPRQQTAVVLRYVHDLTEADIAETMGISRGTVASTLAAARRTLRGSLGEPADEETING